MSNLLIVSSVLLWIFLIINFFVTIGLARRIKARLPEVQNLIIGDRAPEFEIQDLQGRTLAMADYSNKAFAFIFISPGCEPCRKEMAHFESLLSSAEAAGVELIMVSDMSSKETKIYADEFNVNLVTIIAPRDENTFLNDYKMIFSPSYYLIDGQRNIRAGGSSFQSLAASIQSIFGKGGKNTK